ncbi:MAG: ABC transporter ATP-binding protein [Spirochaetes bacterium]|nr:ABC transporter ATP-binding protein [Spirochaetota bacterium]
MEYAIEAINVSKRYGSVRALEDLTMKIEKGKSFGFLGLNGAGKTTFVKIMLNLISPDIGTAKIFGTNSKLIAARKKVGFLPEIMPIYTYLSVKEFLQFHANLIELTPAESAEQIEKVLKLTDMFDNKHKKMETLSKGMRQRAGVAQAMLGNPDLLILDEPTSGLDPVGIKELRDIFLDLKSKGTTIFMNSHLLSEIEKTCDTFAILNKGKIIYTTERTNIDEKEKFLEVRLNNINDLIINEINKISYKKLESYDEYLKVFLYKMDESLKVHEIILRYGGNMRSLTWKGESLEDVFYRLVKEKE